MNSTIITAALTAICTILATIGTINAEESTDLVTSGSAAVTGLGAFVSALLGVIRNHKKKD